MPPRIDPYANKTHRRIDIALIIVTLLILLIVASVARAATIEWANVGTTWSTGTNWVGGTAPADSTVTDIAAFGSTGSTAVNPNLTAQRSVNGISFLSGAFSYTIGGSTLIIGSSGITNSAANTETFSNNLRTSISQTWTNNGGALVFNGSIDIVNGASSTRTLTLTGAGTTTINGVIQNTGGGSTGNISKTGSGTVILNTANTYTGSTSVTGGTLLVNGGTVAGGTSGTGSGNVTVDGSGTTLGGTGRISGSVTLGGTTAGAIINPGPSGTAGTSASVGTLTVGALTLTGANTFHADAFGTSASAWDQLIVTGAVNLNSSSTFQLSIATAGLTFSTSTTYIVIDGAAGQLSGTFSGLSEGAIVTSSGQAYQFYAHYDTVNGDFDLVPVPEPSTWVAATLACLTIGYSLRKRFVRQRVAA